MPNLIEPTSVELVSNLVIRTVLTVGAPTNSPEFESAKNALLDILAALEKVAEEAKFIVDYGGAHEFPALESALSALNRSEPT